jgi:hypothetical protein
LLLSKIASFLLACSLCNDLDPMNIPFAVSDISWVTIYELQRTRDLVNLGKRTENQEYLRTN